MRAQTSHLLASVARQQPKRPPRNLATGLPVLTFSPGDAHFVLRGVAQPARPASRPDGFHLKSAAAQLARCKMMGQKRRRRPELDRSFSSRRRDGSAAGGGGSGTEAGRFGQQLPLSVCWPRWRRSWRPPQSDHSANLNACRPRPLDILGPIRRRCRRSLSKRPWSALVEPRTEPSCWWWNLICRAAQSSPLAQRALAPAAKSNSSPGRARST